MKKGYSLVEAAIALCVMGVLSGVIFSTMNIKREVDSAKGIITKLDRIQLAIDSFYAKNGYLPCPSSLSQAQNTASFGILTDCAVAAPSGTFESGTGVDTIRRGAVPNRSIGLSDEFMVDEWDNRISYTVIKNLATSKATYDAYTTASTDVIRINDSNGNRITRANAVGDENIVMYTLVSHGKEGRGAYKTSGGLRLACGSELDSENCDNDNLFIDTSYNIATGRAFDNYIRWRTRAQQILFGKPYITAEPAETSGTCGDPFDPPTFSPTSISGLRLWIDAKDGSKIFSNTACTTPIADNGHIMCVKDKSANNYTLTQSSNPSRPKWMVSGSNHYIEFKTNANLKLVGAPSGAVFSNGSTLTGMEFFAVYVSTGSANAYAFYHHAASDISFSVPRSDNKIYWTFNGTHAGDSVAWGGDTSTMYKWNCNASVNGASSSQKCWRDDTLLLNLTTTLTAPTIDTSDFYLGCKDTTNCQKHDLYELIIFNKVLSDDERGEVSTYLNYKWAIQQ